MITHNCLQSAIRLLARLATKPPDSQNLHPERLAIETLRHILCNKGALTAVAKNNAGKLPFVFDFQPCGNRLQDDCRFVAILAQLQPHVCLDIRISPYALAARPGK